MDRGQSKEGFASFELLTVSNTDILYLPAEPDQENVSLLELIQGKKC